MKRAMKSLQIFWMMSLINVTVVTRRWVQFHMAYFVLYSTYKEGTLISSTISILQKILRSLF